MKGRPHKNNRKNRWTLILSGSIFSLLFVLSVIIFRNEHQTIAEMETWLPTKASVVAHRTFSVFKGRAISVKAEYLVNEVGYKSTIFASRQLWKKGELVDPEYIPDIGETVDIIYDPKNPENAALKGHKSCCGVGIEDPFITVWHMGVLLLLSIMCWWSFIYLKKKR